MDWGSGVERHLKLHDNVGGVAKVYFKSTFDIQKCHVRHILLTPSYRRDNQFARSNRSNVHVVHPSCTVVFTGTKRIFITAF